MQVIGLTGSIASGKSTVLAMCKELGAAVVDADVLVHQLLSTDKTAIDAVAEAFPDALENGAINRKKLGEIVFSDDAKLAALESLLHPMVAAEKQRWIEAQKAAGYKFVVIEIPLLFETNQQNDFSSIIATKADQDIIEARALARPGMTKEKLAAILARQWPQEKKCELADLVVDTARSEAENMQALKSYLTE